MTKFDDTKLFNYLKDNNLIKYKDNNNYTITCSCGRTLTQDDEFSYHFLDMNYFDWWSYSYHNNNLLDKKSQYIIVNKKPIGYLGYVPIVNEMVYYLYKFFHKKNEIAILECDKCFDGDDE